MQKLSCILIVSLFLIACTNQVSANDESIVVGVIRTLFNLPDTYVIDTSGLGSIRVRPPADLNSKPEWSPDGEWIISSSQYEEGRPEDSVIYLIRSDSGQKQLVIHNSGGSFDPTWSPDGTHIAYYARDNQKGIYILDMQCFEYPELKCDPLPVYLTSGDSSPDWSPDGTQIVYEKEGNIFVVNSDGTEPSVNITSSMSYCYNPNWSPDGKRIVFSCYQADTHDVFVIKSNGSNLINLTNGISSNTKPN